MSRTNEQFPINLIEQTEDNDYTIKRFFKDGFIELYTKQGDDYFLLTVYFDKKLNISEVPEEIFTILSELDFIKKHFQSIFMSDNSKNKHIDINNPKFIEELKNLKKTLQNNSYNQK